jgi:hypothetical protein
MSAREYLILLAGTRAWITDRATDRLAARFVAAAVS